MTDYTDLIAKLEAVPEGSRLAKRIKLDKESGCWLWQGGLDKRKRGRIWVKNKHGKSMLLAHRAVWRVLRYPIQNGKLLCHHCDNPQCVNPDHLYVGTQADNVRDMMKRGRHWTTKEPERARQVGRASGQNNNWMKGERNPRAKLEAWQVEEIRSSTEPSSKLARWFGVHRTTIQRIRRGALWSEAALKARAAVESEG